MCVEGHTQLLTIRHERHGSREKRYEDEMGHVCYSSFPSILDDEMVHVRK